MKKWFLFLCLFIAGQASARDYFESLGGISLGMRSSAVEKAMNANGMKKKKTKRNLVFYEGKDVEIYGVLFNKAEVEYEDKEVSRITFSLFIPRSEGAQRRLFRILHERLKRISRGVTDENIRFHYRYTVKTQDGTQYLRAFIEEVVQGDSGYNLFLSCDYNKRFE